MQISFTSALSSLLLLNAIMLASGLPTASSIGNRETDLRPYMPLDPASNAAGRINKGDPNLSMRALCMGPDGTWVEC